MVGNMLGSSLAMAPAFVAAQGLILSTSTGRCGSSQTSSRL
ncbi:MAG: hypothetical protein CM15mP103_02530 [Gammaproteobacteria bacterium]|nr:MAG: hypothetical protein CM15mP103_02530 [Gammaproteobacteria bacterium]